MRLADGPDRPVIKTVSLTLDRHLGARDMTPDDYRKKWGLPAYYPMVSPAYSATRSALAKALGLGGRPTAKAKTKRSKK